jgi:hypothetical protein
MEMLFILSNDAGDPSNVYTASGGGVITRPRFLDLVNIMPGIDQICVARAAFVELPMLPPGGRAACWLM